MLKWAALFLFISLVAGLLGYTIIAGFAASIAKMLVILFLILLVVFIGRGLSRYRRINR